ncbi:MAG: YjbQ family protein, partial [Desulfobacterales bacterium]|nr:YjbQ family protein [Desulfobacterales bacterium]
MIVTVKTSAQTEFVDITADIQGELSAADVQSGLCMVYVPHTTAAVTINESADPSVKKDILMVLNRVIPWQAEYRHLEGNSPAHLKSTIVGASELVMVENG